MKRRKFLKLLAGSSSLIALPAIAKVKEKDIVKLINTEIDKGNNIEGEYFGPADIEDEIFKFINNGSGTRNLLISKLLEVPGVTRVGIIEDLELHSIEIMVEGGTDFDIATCIVFNKSVAVGTSGDIIKKISYNGNFISLVRFSRFGNTIEGTI